MFENMLLQPYTHLAHEHPKTDEIIIDDVWHHNILKLCTLITLNAYPIAAQFESIKKYYDDQFCTQFLKISDI